MKRPRILDHLAGLAILWLCAGSPAIAAEVRVAVASNFTTAAREIVAAFEVRSGHEVTLAFGSTGKHYAQIRNGAPMDVLLAADERRPRLLEEGGSAVRGSRFTYAVGRLVLWSPRPGIVVDGPSVLEGGDFRHLAIGNPKLAPYGAAAQEVLEALSLWDGLQPRIVRGENIAQTLQFIDSGNAELGFIAASQLTDERRSEGSFWEVPQDLHSPIGQQAVLLRITPAATEFMTFLGGDEAREILRRNGYGVP
jgi:molybdate transport system substrate-binding protein